VAHIYSLANVAAYENNLAIVKVIAEKGRAIDKTLLDDSMDMSSESLGAHEWTPEGLRFSITRWVWEPGYPQITEGGWKHFRYSDIVLSAADIEALVEASPRMS